MTCSKTSISDGANRICLAKSGDIQLYFLKNICTVIQMGVNYAYLKYIENLIANEGRPQEVLFLGRQSCKDLSRRASKLIERNYSSVNKEVPDRRENYYADMFMIDCGWAVKTDSLDISNYEGANLLYDLNKRIQLGSTYDLIIDAGTLEHVFNVPIALENISSLLKVGGRVIHFVPANSYMGHGLYQFSPEFFASVYSEMNGFSNSKIFLYDWKKKRKLYRVKVQNLHSRIEIRKSGMLEVWCDAKKLKDISKVDVQQTDYLLSWEGFKEVRVSDEEFHLKYGKASPLLMKIRKNKVTYLVALYMHKLYRRFFCQSVSRLNLDLVEIPWK